MKSFLKEIVAAIIEKEAKAVLKRFDPSIVAITGSVGKTSTKDAIFTAFSAFVKTRKSQKSFNSEIGAPLTVLGLPNAWKNPFLWLVNILKGFFILVFSRSYPTWLVLEVGADRPGGISRTAAWAKPHITVLTRFPDVPVHVEFFPSAEDVVKEKMTLVEAAREGGTLVVNKDDPIIMDAVKRQARTILSYGFSEGADVRGSDYVVLYEKKGRRKVVSGFSFSVTRGGEIVHLSQKGALGLQHAYPLLAALATSLAAGFDMQKAAKALSSHETPPGRMKILPGKNETTLIDDSYNSSPVAASLALKTLKELNVTGRKIAVLGDMLELGKFSVAEHEAIGREAAFADILVTVGPRSRDSADAVRKAKKEEKNIFSFAESVRAGEYLSHIVEPGDVVLVKGSQGMRMEKIVAALLFDPKTAKQVLVRQDKEWRKR